MNVLEEGSLSRAGTLTCPACIGVYRVALSDVAATGMECPKCGEYLYRHNVRWDDERPPAPQTDGSPYR